MRTGAILGISFATVFVVFLLVNMIIWINVSSSHFSKRRLKPKETYSIGRRTYAMPDIKVTGKDVPLLKEDFLEKQRSLLVDVLKVLEEGKIEHWISGGTLLGFLRHGTFMPWDDDIDVHAKWEHREHMFSKEFAKDVKRYNLETFFLRGVSSLGFATKEGAAVRIRRRGTSVPVCDVFFVREKKDLEITDPQEREEKRSKAPSEYAKVDSWRSGGTHVTFSARETWPSSDLFPVQRQVIDDINLPIPRKAEAVLKKQYGDDVFERAQARRPLFSHAYPFRFLHFVWKAHRV